MSKPCSCSAIHEMTFNGNTKKRFQVIEWCWRIDIISLKNQTTFLSHLCSYVEVFLACFWGTAWNSHRQFCASALVVLWRFGGCSHCNVRLSDPRRDTFAEEVGTTCCQGVGARRAKWSTDKSYHMCGSVHQSPLCENIISDSIQIACNPWWGPSSAFVSNTSRDRDLVIQIYCCCHCF